MNRLTNLNDYFNKIMKNTTEINNSVAPISQGMDDIDKEIQEYRKDQKALKAVLEKEKAQKLGAKVVENYKDDSYESCPEVKELISDKPRLSKLKSYFA